MWMSGKGCEIEWGVYRGVPDVPPTGEARKCVGEVVDVRLEPLGGAKLHLVDMPVLKLGGGREGGGEGKGRDGEAKREGGKKGGGSALRVGVGGIGLAVSLGVGVLLV